MSAGSLKAHPHICQLERIKQGKIYVGRHAYSAHDISGPMCYMWLKDISRLRLAGMLYAPLWHIYVCTYSVMSHNTHVTAADIPASSESWHPPLSHPHDFRDSQNEVPHSNSVVIKPRPYLLFIV